LLSTQFDNKKYYVIDLNGNLSRSIKDGLIFLSRDDADMYIPGIESKLKIVLDGAANLVNAESINLMSIISDTLFERISCSGNNN
jgi:hypothetical protein